MPKKSKRRHKKSELVSQINPRARVAEIPENRFLVISFKYHHKKECELLDINNAQQYQQIINKLIKVTSEDRLTSEQWLFRKPVLPQGNYESLYNDLDSEITLYEGEILGKEGRIFYFLENTICHIRAIKRSYIKY